MTGNTAIVRQQDFFTNLETLVSMFCKDGNTETLRAVLPPGVPEKAALDLTGLLNAMASLGRVGCPVRLSADKIDPRLLPCLFVPEDPDKDVCILTQSVQDMQKGTAWFFVAEKDRPDTLSEEIRKAAGFTWFRALLERFRGLFLQILVLGGVLAVVSLATPLFVMAVYDRVVEAHAPETLTPLLTGVLLALGIEGILRFMRAGVLAWFGARLNYIVSTHIFERLMHMPPIFTERASVASQIARIKAFEAVRDFFTGPLFLALAEFPFTVLIMIAIALIAGPVAFVPLVTAAAYAALFFIMRQHIRAAVRLAGQAGAARQETVIETFEKMDSLRTGGLTSAWFRQFRDLSGKASLAGFRAAWLASLVETLAHALYILAGLAVLMLGVERIWDGVMTPGALVATLILVWRVLTPLQTFCNALPRYEQLKNAVAQINRLMQIETEDCTAGTGEAQLPALRGKVTFSRVGLRYTKEQGPVFTGLSFEAPPGALIMITGGNGAGKSTILKLVNGLYRPQAGTVQIDGIDIRQLPPRDLRRNIAYVPQTPELYEGTIVDNLRFAAPDADEQAMIEALQQADVWEDVKALPEALHTSVSDIAAAPLSYGIALARAYMKHAQIMLIDELPYAFLNSKAGETFRENLKKGKGRKTVLMITHREDYLKLADRVILLRTGASPFVGYPEQVIENIYTDYGRIKNA